MDVKTTFRSWTLLSIAGSALQVCSLSDPSNGMQPRACGETLYIPACSVMSCLQWGVMHAV